jgi:hypothetical protein
MVLQENNIANIFLIFSFLLVVGCQNLTLQKDNQEIIYIHTTYEGEKGQLTDSLEMYFMTSFNHTPIKVNYRNRIIFNDVITTDPSVGLAKYLYLKIDPKFDTVDVSVNYNNFEIIEFAGYSTMYVEVNSDTLFVTISNKQRYFK